MSHSLPSGLVGQLLFSLSPLDRRPPRDASPPFLPAILASSLVNSCAVPFWWAARPPLAAIARCAWGSIAANPRGVLRLAPPVLRDSAPLSPLVPFIVPLLPPPTPLLRPIRSSILTPWLSACSAIINLLPRISSLSVAPARHPSCERWKGRSEGRVCVSIPKRKGHAAIFGRGRADRQSCWEMWISASFPLV